MISKTNPIKLCEQVYVKHSFDYYLLLIFTVTHGLFWLKTHDYTALRKSEPVTENFSYEPHVPIMLKLKLSVWSCRTSCPIWLTFDNCYALAHTKLPESCLSSRPSLNLYNLCSLCIICIMYYIYHSLGKSWSTWNLIYTRQEGLIYLITWAFQVSSLLGSITSIGGAST